MNISKWQSSPGLSAKLSPETMKSLQSLPLTSHRPWFSRLATLGPSTSATPQSAPARPEAHRQTPLLHCPCPLQSLRQRVSRMSGGGRETPGSGWRGLVTQREVFLVTAWRHASCARSRCSRAARVSPPYWGAALDSSYPSLDSLSYHGLWTSSKLTSCMFDEHCL